MKSNFAIQLPSLIEVAEDNFTHGEIKSWSKENYYSDKMIEFQSFEELRVKIKDLFQLDNIDINTDNSELLIICWTELGNGDEYKHDVNFKDFSEEKYDIYQCSLIIDRVYELTEIDISTLK